METVALGTCFICTSKTSRMNEGGRKDRTCTPRRKLWKRKGSLTLGSPFTGREISWDCKIWVLEESRTASMWQAGQRDRSAGSPGQLCTPQPKSLIYCCTRGLRCRNSVFCRQTRGEDWGLLPADTRTWSGPQFGVQRTEPESAIKASLLTHARREGRVPTSASRSVCSVDTALLPAALGALEPAGCPHVEVGLKSEPVPRGCLSL